MKHDYKNGGLYKLMTVAGMTCSELATALDTHKPTVSLWVTGKCEPRLETVVKLSEIFGCTCERVIRAILESRKIHGRI